MYKETYHPIKMIINPLEHWKHSMPKDIERELTGIIIDKFKEAYKIAPKLQIIGFRKTRKTMRGTSGIGRFHKNWALFSNLDGKVDVKVNVKVN